MNNSLTSSLRLSLHMSDTATETQKVQHRNQELHSLEINSASAGHSFVIQTVLHAPAQLIHYCRQYQKQLLLAARARCRTLRHSMSMKLC
eukprot:m.1535639 g.1535639  ORF g.1535639 m.1535639 type:complete len:90 (+) comp25243_c0_seq79:128-397(+)